MQDRLRHTPTRVALGGNATAVRIYPMLRRASDLSRPSRAAIFQAQERQGAHWLYVIFLQLVGKLVQ
jgi:hypothetical protein